MWISPPGMWMMCGFPVRDLTDAMYNPVRPPHLGHDDGTRLVIEHIARYWCPPVLSDELRRAWSAASS